MLALPLGLAVAGIQSPIPSWSQSLCGWLHSENHRQRTATLLCNVGFLTKLSTSPDTEGITVFPKGVQFTENSSEFRQHLQKLVHTYLLWGVCFLLFNFEEHIFLGKGIVLNCLVITLPFCSLKIAPQLLICYHDMLSIQKAQSCARHHCPPGCCVHFFTLESQALFRAPCVSVGVSECAPKCVVPLCTCLSGYASFGGLYLCLTICQCVCMPVRYLCPGYLSINLPGHCMDDPATSVD